MSGGPNGYVIVPCALIRDNTLSSFDFRLLVLLLSYDFADKETRERKGTVWPAMGTLAKLLQVHRNTVQGSLRRLEAGGYIVKLSGGGGRQRTNRYRLKLHNALCSIGDTESESAQSDVQSAQSEGNTAHSESDKLHNSYCAGTLVKETQEVETEEKETETPSQESENRGQAQWTAVLDEMTCQLGRDRITSLRAVTQAERRDGALVVTVRNPVQFDWLQGRARVTMARMVAALADGARLEFEQTA